MNSIKLFANNKTNKPILDDYLMYRSGTCEEVAKDFDSYLETGFFSWATIELLKQCSNRPCDELGVLIVKNNKSTSNPMIYHRYTTDSREIYLRTCSSGVWSSWEKQVNESKYKKADTITLTTTWVDDTANSGYYTQTISYKCSANDVPILGLKTESSKELNETIENEYAKIKHSETIDGSIKFFASEPTTQEINILVKGI